jgi:hypothetical protein
MGAEFFDFLFLNIRVLGRQLTQNNKKKTQTSTPRKSTQNFSSTKN